MASSRNVSQGLNPLMTRLWLYFFVSFFAATPPSLAGVDLSTAVVKTHSSSSDETVHFVGSGLLFRNSNTIYVLSSEHVIFNLSPGKHQVTSEVWGELDVSLVYHDWGNGIALLKVDEPPRELIDSPLIPSLDHLNSTDAVSHSEVQIAGFPADSDQLIPDSGTITSTAVAKPLLAQQPKLIEITGARGEYGMSGGPVLNSSGEWLGVLSHQKLFEGKEGDQELLYAIPAKGIRDLLTQFLQHPETNQPTLAISENNQLKYINWKKGSQFAISSREWMVSFSQLPLLNFLIFVPYQNPNLASYHDRCDWLASVVKAQATQSHSAFNEESIWIGQFRRNDDLRESLLNPIRPQSMADFFQRLEDPNLSPSIYRDVTYPNTDFPQYQKYIPGFKAAMKQLPKGELQTRLSTLEIALEADRYLSTWSLLSPNDLDEVLDSKSFQKWRRDQPITTKPVSDALIELRRMTETHTLNGRVSAHCPR